MFELTLKVLFAILVVAVSLPLKHWIITTSYQPRRGVDYVIAVLSGIAGIVVIGGLIVKGVFFL